MSQSTPSGTSTPTTGGSSTTEKASAHLEEHESVDPTDRSATRERANRMARSAAETTQQYAQEYTQHYVTEPARDLISLAKDFARDKPDVAACWCFALGVIVGWKLKP